MDWTDFFSGIASAGSSIASAVIGPRLPQAIPGNPGAVYIPSGATGSIVSTGGILGGVGGSSSSLLLILLAVVLIFALKK